MKKIKTVYFVRHAKAENHDLNKPDFNRCLIEKGIGHSEKMAALLKSFKFPPEVIYSSPAQRARQTSEIFSNVLGISEKVRYVDDFYPGSTVSYLNFLQKLDDKEKTVMIIAHNPALEEVVMQLCSRAGYNLKMPTCAIAGVNFFADLWSEIKPGAGVLRLLLYPKMFSTN